MDSLIEENRLLKQQVETLQERLRGLERERREAKCIITITKCCPMCTYTNEENAESCEICKTTLQKTVEYTGEQNLIQCDC